MDSQSVMQGFPPPPESQATLANWRSRPFNRWAFHHVREIVPSADVPAEPGKARPLPRRDADYGGLRVPRADGPPLDLDGFLAATDTDAIVVLHEGRVVLERYDGGNSARTPHILMSVSKSVLGLLAGILADRGILEPERPAADYVPELAATAYSAATVRHLLDMRVGIAFDEDYGATSGPIVEYRKATNWNPLGPGDAPSDLRSFYAGLTGRDGPDGGRFHYVSPNTDLLGWIYERASGRRYADLLSELLWAPMGAETNAYITVDRLGAPRCAGGLCVTAPDLARLGQLVLEDGRRDGRQIVPAAWIADIATNGDRTAWRGGAFVDLFPMPGMSYRSQWYIDQEGGPLMFGFGIHGQHLFVDRERGIVVAKQSSQALPIDADRMALTLRGVAAIADRLAGPGA